MTASAQQLEKIARADGFIAALDQSGGSTPKALQLYGIAPGEYGGGDEEMFAKVHQMRTRIITNPAFHGDQILAAILFENTVDREIEGKPSAQYLWQEKRIVPILKVDKGLAEEADGVQLMKPNPDLETLLEKAVAQGIFGTKMRSLIKHANAAGIAAVVAQQFDIGKTIIRHGLMPIIEPEVDIHCAQKAAAEVMLKDEITAQLDGLNDRQRIMLKLTLPETADFYQSYTAQPNCLKVAALSGGYPRAEACQRLADNHAMIASFSRALTEGLSAQQTEAEFTAKLSAAIAAIAAASAT